MSITINITNKNSFIRFLTAASMLYDQCILTCNSKQKLMSVFVSTESEEVIMYSEFFNIDVSDDVTLNIPDLKKIIKLIEYIPADTFNLTINNNSISYNTPELSFKYHLYEDGIIRVKKMNTNMLKQFEGEYVFTVSSDDISNLLKTNSVLGTNEFVYISGVQGKIICEFTNKKIANLDSVKITLLDTGDVNLNFREMKFKLEDIRILGSLRGNTLAWRLHTKYNCIVSVVKIDGCEGYYWIAEMV